MPKLLTTQSDTDLLIAHLMGKGKAPISPKLQEKMERLEHCADLIRQYGSRLKVIPMLTERYGISRSTAYQDFEDTQLVFGTTPRNSRAFWIDILLGMIVTDIENARTKKDYKALAAMQRNFIQLIAQMGEPENDAYEKIQPVNIMMGFFPEKTNVEKLSDEEIEAAFKRLSKAKRKANLLLDAQDVEPLETPSDGE